MVMFLDKGDGALTVNYFYPSRRRHESDQPCINKRVLTGVIIAASALKVDSGVLVRTNTRSLFLIRLPNVVNEDTMDQTHYHLAFTCLANSNTDHFHSSENKFIDEIKLS